METVRKKITIDTIKSHRNSIQPYCRFGDEDWGPFNVTEDDSNGTYGQFACDYGVMSDGKVVSRMKYLDAVRKYRYTQEQIKQGIPVILVDDNTVTITNTDDCNYDVSFSGSMVSKWSTHVPEHEKYDYKPVDMSLFNIGSDGYYYYDNSADIDDEDETIDPIGDSTALLLIPEYTSVMVFEQDWDTWWTNAYKTVYPDGEGSWEEAFLDENYVRPEFFKFCQDFEKYTLGLVSVPLEIEGSKVPEVVFYLNYKDYIQWFDDNRDIHEHDIAFKREWDARGGDAFYNFLQTIEPKWITRREDTPDETYFTYIVPEITLGYLMTANVIPEWEYAPYEYSVIDDELVDVTEDYVCPQSGTGSALTPHFVTFESGETGTVESQLTTLVCSSATRIGVDLVGVFERFNEEGNAQLFKCTFHQGTSTTPRVDVYYSGHTSITKRRTVIAETGEKLQEYAEDVGYVSETFVETINEVAPKVKSNCYQVTGLEVIDTEEDLISAEGPVMEDDVEKYYWSATTLNTYEWWECEKVEMPEGMRCADGETVLPNDNTKYKNVLTLSMIPTIADSEVEGDVYYFMALYDNGNVSGDEKSWTADETEITDVCEIKSVKVPFAVGEERNNTTFDDGTEVFDSVISMTVDESGNMVFEYVLGATKGADIATSGIHYKESVPFNEAERMEIPVDGVVVAEVYVDNLDFEKAMPYIYNEDFEISRPIKFAEITGMEVATTWDSEKAISAMLITKDGLGAVNGDIKYDVSVMIDRGTGAAWENYFKLSECNTFNDLANYSNNFFNL